MIFSRGNGSKIWRLSEYGYSKGFNRGNRLFDHSLKTVSGGMFLVS